jgi:protein O-GlcNAc transferase
MQTPTDSIVNAALAQHRSGNLAEAERLYIMALTQAPHNVDALCYLAMIHCQKGQFAKGIELLRTAVATAPTRASAHNLLGMAHHRLGQLEAALSSFDLAIACEPGLADAHGSRAAVLLDLRRYPEVIETCDRALALMPQSVADWCTRASALAEMGRHEEAIASIDNALAHNPRAPEAHFNRGLCLAKLMRYEESLSAYTNALAINPRMVPALNDRGNVLQKLGRPEEALTSYEQAIALSPDHAEAFHNRGNALAALKRHEQALASYERATALNPGHAEAFQNRGVALTKLGRIPDALADFQRAVELRPDDPEFMYCKARALHALGRLPEALTGYDRAIALNPNYADALYDRGNALLLLRRFDEALQSYDQALNVGLDLTQDFLGGRLSAKLYLCDWRDFDQDCAQLISAIENGKGVEPNALLGIQSTPQQQLRSARLYAAASWPKVVKPPGRGEGYSQDRIRVAYLSSDLRAHPVGTLTVGLFEQHDKSRFEVIAFSNCPEEDSEIHRRIKRAFSQFHNVFHRNDQEIAGLMRELEIDIAVDLNGFTHGTRTGALALRGAPIQINYLGYPATMGADFVDYIIADCTIIPLEQQSFYSEQVIYLPHCYQPNDDKREISGTTPSRAEEGLPEHGFVFCAFNNSFKINPPTFDVWMRLLRRFDGSVLWLTAPSASAVVNLRREAEARGVSSDRVIFARRVAHHADHLARQRLADLFIDTLPYNAQTTASDALWAGLPVLTCMGSTYTSRVAGSLLTTVGLPELVTHSLADYEALAVQLTSDPERLQ